MLAIVQYRSVRAPLRIEDRHAAGRHPPDVAIERLLRILAVDRQILREDQLVEVTRRLGQREQRLQRRGEEDLVGTLDIKERARTERIAGERQLSRTLVPQGKGEAAVKPFGGAGAPSLAGGGDQRGVAHAAPGLQAQGYGDLRRLVEPAVGGDDRARRQFGGQEDRVGNVGLAERSMGDRGRVATPDAGLADTGQASGQAVDDRRIDATAIALENSCKFTHKTRSLNR